MVKRRFVPESTALPSEAAVEIAMGERLWQELVEAGAPWWQRLQSVHRQLIQAYGVPLPSIELFLDRRLPPQHYGLRLAHGGWEQGELKVQRWFATGPSEVVEMLMGEAGVEPIYGLPGRWIPESRVAGARELGCHLLQPEALWVGHLCDRLEARLDRVVDMAWLSRRWQQLGLGRLGAGPAQVCRWLLQERVSLSCLELIAEACRGRRRAELQLKQARQLLGAHRLVPWITGAGSLPALTLSEGSLRRLEREWSRPGGPEEYFLHRLLHQIHVGLEEAQAQGQDLVLLVSSPVRRGLFELLPWPLRRLPVLAYEELPPDLEVVEVARVGHGLLGLLNGWPGFQNLFSQLC